MAPYKTNPRMGTTGYKGVLNVRDFTSPPPGDKAPPKEKLRSADRHPDDDGEHS